MSKRGVGWWILLELVGLKSLRKKSLRSIAKYQTSIKKLSLENISLEYVKKHIEKIDGVDFCKLKKVESSTWGQVLHASIKCSKNITEHSIRRKLNERLANYMIPKIIIIIWF